MQIDGADLSMDLAGLYDVQVALLPARRKSDLASRRVDLKREATESSWRICACTPAQHFDARRAFRALGYAFNGDGMDCEWSQRPVQRPHLPRSFLQTSLLPWP